MTDIEQIMKGIETRLATITGLRHSDTVKGEISPPFAMVGLPRDIDYHAAMGRDPLGDMTFEVWVFTSRAWDSAGQRQLAGYMNQSGPKSIRAAIEADQQLGGIVDDCIVRRGRAVTVEEFGVIGYFGGVFTVPVFVKGTP